MTARRKKVGRIKSAAVASAEKTKQAIQFVYKHRKKILDALEVIAAVVGTASTIVGKPKPSRRRKRKPGRKAR